MNKAFEKIIERIDKEIPVYTGKANQIVQKVAEEYNGGWIPCSERLPDDDSICIVTVEYPNKETVVDYGWFDKKGICWFVGMQEFRTSNVLAWQPLSEQYKEVKKDEK